LRVAEKEKHLQYYKMDLMNVNLICWNAKVESKPKRKGGKSLWV